MENLTNNYNNSIQEIYKDKDSLDLLFIIENCFSLSKRVPSTQHNLSLALCMRGSGVILVGGNSLSYSPGDICVLNSHSININERIGKNEITWRVISIHLDNLLSLCDSNSVKVQLSDFSPANPHVKLIKQNSFPDFCQLCRIFFNSLSHFSEKIYLRQLTLCICTLTYLQSISSTDTQSITISTERSQELINPALEYIAENLTNNFSVSHLAAICNLSESSLRRRFLQYTGLSPMSYIYNARISLAKQILQEKKVPISEVAAIVGYDSLSSFNRHFKKYIGISPRDFRKQNSA